MIKGAVKMDLFHRLSGSRLLSELMLLLSEEEPRHAIARLDQLDLLRFIHPKLKRTAQLNAMLKQIEEALDWYRLLYLDRTLEAWLVYWMALMDLLPAGAMEETLARLAISAPGDEDTRGPYSIVLTTPQAGTASSAHTL